MPIIRQSTTKAMERIHTVLVNLNFDDKKDNKNEENPINIKK